MKSEVLLAVIMKQVEEKLEDFSRSVLASRNRGPAGRAGNDGRDGKDFHFADHEQTIKDWAKEFSLKFQDLSTDEIEQLRGPRGRDGAQGRDGHDFIFSEHEHTIKDWAKEFALKFEDFTAEQINILRGPRGLDGAEGRAGRDFDFKEHEEEIKSLLPKFEDFSAEQIEKIRGPRGRDGKDGRDFVFEDNCASITQIIYELVGELHDQLRLKFSDLTAEEVEGLRGPRGRDGNDGRGFNFEEHRDFFEGLKPRFSDFTAEEREQLRLRFEHLSESEKAEIKLTFSDLTEEDRRSLRGARGGRGQRGSQGAEGKDGKQGKQGARGLPGAQGTKGLDGRNGVDGRDGHDGEDASYVTDITTDQTKDEVEFIFDFSDGMRLRTNPVKLPRPNVFISGGSSHSRSGSSESTPGSGITRKIFNVSSPQALGSDSLTDYVYFVSGNTEVIMPTAEDNSNLYTVKNTGSGTVTVVFVDGQNADGSTPISISPGQALGFVSNSSNWEIV